MCSRNQNQNIKSMQQQSLISGSRYMIILKGKAYCSHSNAQGCTRWKIEHYRDLRLPLNFYSRNEIHHCPSPFTRQNWLHRLIQLVKNQVIWSFYVPGIQELEIPKSIVPFFSWLYTIPLYMDIGILDRYPLFFFCYETIFHIYLAINYLSLSIIIFLG